MKTLRPTDVLEKWAYYGALMRHSGAKEQRSWEPAHRMVETLRKRAVAEAARLQAYLRESNDALAPLGEPLLVDFGLHRWLKEQREESYSDWLAWIVDQLRDTPELVFQLFRMQGESAIRDNETPLTLCPVDRETPVTLDPGENPRRLDLLIKGNQANSSELYIIEVKLTDPESADTEKQRIYYQWLEKQPGVQRREAVLVALEGKKGYYEGFRLFPWSNLCVELRKIIRTALLRQKPIVAALALAFVGAVEENLLRFSGRLVQHVYTGEVPPLVTTEISDHLGKFLLEVDNDSRK